jgi:hypothetical protein
MIIGDLIAGNDALRDGQVKNGIVLRSTVPARGAGRPRDQALSWLLPSPCRHIQACSRHRPERSEQEQTSDRQSLPSVVHLAHRAYQKCEAWPNSPNTIERLQDWMEETAQPGHFPQGRFPKCRVDGANQRQFTRVCQTRSGSWKRPSTKLSAARSGSADKD